MDQDTFRLIALWKPPSILDSDALKVNTIAVGFQREERLMEVEFILASLYNLQTVSEEKQINQQAERVRELLVF